MNENAILIACIVSTVVAALRGRTLFGTVALAVAVHSLVVVLIALGGLTEGEPLWKRRLADVLKEVASDTLFGLVVAVLTSPCGVVAGLAAVGIRCLLRGPWRSRGVSPDSEAADSPGRE